MSKYQSTLTIKGSDQEEVNTKAQALAILAQRLKAKELKKLAHTVENDKIKTALAKKYLGL